MRDIKRIKRILTKIEKIWKKVPDQRLFQMLMNYTNLGQTDRIGYVYDPFHIEDDTLELYLDELIKNNDD